MAHHVLLGLRQGGDETGREHAIDDAARGHTVHERVLALAQELEARVAENGPPMLLAVAMGSASVGVEQSTDVTNPRRSIVAKVPDQRQVSARSCDAQDLFGGPGIVEPVKGRCAT